MDLVILDILLHFQSHLMEFGQFYGLAGEQFLVAQQGAEVAQAFVVPLVEYAGGDEAGEVEPGAEFVAVPGDGERHPFGESPYL